MFMVASSVVLTLVVLNYHHRTADIHTMGPWVNFCTRVLTLSKLSITDNFKNVFNQALKMCFNVTIYYNNMFESEIIVNIRWNFCFLFFLTNEECLGRVGN